MKPIFLLPVTIFALCLFTNLSYAQQITATYKVFYNLESTGATGETIKLPTLEFTAHYFQNSNRSISYLIPNYLDKYPEGKIPLASSQLNHFSYTYVCKDSLTAYSFRNHDSLLWVYTDLSTPGIPAKPYSFRYQPGYMKWNILSDTRNIAGLNCQRATYYDEGNLIWDVWFSPDIPTGLGLGNIIGLPGLMVEGELFSMKMKYSLQSYDLTKQVPDSVFTPVIFDQPILHRGTIFNRNKQ